MGSLHAGERSLDSANSASTQPSFIDVSKFYDQSHLGWTTDSKELSALEATTKNASVKNASAFVRENSPVIEALSPKGEPGLLTNGDLKLYRNLSRVDTAANSIPFLEANFAAMDKNDNGKLTMREVRKFGDKNSIVQNQTDNILSGFGLIAGASGKRRNTIEAKDLTSMKDENTVMEMMHKEYKNTEFGRRSAPISLTVGGTMAFFAGMADGTQAEKQQAVQNAFRTGAMLGKLVSYPFLNKSIDNYYEKSGREAITKLFG